MKVMKAGSCLSGYWFFRPFSDNVGFFGACHEFRNYVKWPVCSSGRGCGMRLFSRNREIEENVEEGEENVGGAKSAEDVLRKWGCDNKIVAKILQRCPSVRKAVPKLLDSKLSVLSKYGVGCADLVNIIHHRPRLLFSRINHKFEERLGQLQSLLGTKEVVLKAIIRNPSLLVYNFEKEVQPVISLYEQLGIGKQEFISMLLLRPTLIPRTNICDEKLDYIQKTGVTKDSKMYKYVVSILGVSRVATIREKVANLEKFGFSEHDVLKLFGRSPLLMTLSVEKVQRNMTYVVATMKIPASTIFDYPFLLFTNLETTLRPRILLAGKIQDMGLKPQIKGPMLFRALRMTEERFLKAFVRCHEMDVRKELYDYYKSSQDIKRLAASSKKLSHTQGFPF